MKIRILGSAAGGGFPQWNCACRNCQGVRDHSLQAQARTQSQVAISSDGERWHLLNASPDLRQQIHSHRDLQPAAQAQTPRHSPVQSVVFTNADIDHTAGLLLLRESQPLRIYATDFVRTALCEGNAYFRMLNQFAGHSRWEEIHTGQAFELQNIDESATGLFCQPIALDGSSPFWARGLFDKKLSAQAVIGLVIEDRATGGRLGFFPGVGALTASLRQEFTECDTLLLDGTFWDNEELVRLRPGSRTALQMQHVPISGAEGSLQQLSGLSKSQKKIYTHINNTNPILDERSAEHAQVVAAGWQIAFDGLEVHL